MSGLQDVTWDDVIRRLTKAERQALDAIYCGQHPYRSQPKTLLSLVDKGLVQVIQKQSRDGLGVFTWNEYGIGSIGAHMAWCSLYADDEEEQSTPEPDKPPPSTPTDEMNAALERGETARLV